MSANKQFEFLDLFLSPLMLTCSMMKTAGSVCLCGVSSPVVVLGLLSEVVLVYTVVAVSVICTMCIAVRV